MDGVTANANNLALTAGAGNITFTGAIGGTTPLGAITLNSANNINFNAVTATSILQSAGSGTTTFNGVVNTNGSAGIQLTGTNFAINNNITTTNNGPLDITHSGTLTIASGANLNISGGFNDSGTGTIDLSGNITSSGSLTFNLPVLLVGDASLNTSGGSGNVTFGSTLDGAQNLTLSTGNGDITCTGAVGNTTPLETLTINSANNFTANALTLAAFNQNAGSGTTTFNGAVNLSGASGLSIVTDNATFNNTLTTTNNGPASIQVAGLLTLSSGSNFSLGGAFTQSGTGSVSLSGINITAGGAISVGSPLTVSGNVQFSTAAASQNITLSSSVSGAGNFTLAAGGANISLLGNVGSPVALGNFVITSANNVTTLGITAASIDQQSGTGTTTINGNYNTSASTGISLTGNNFTLNNYIITTNAGPLVLTNSGLLSFVSGSSTLIDGYYLQNGTGAVNFSGTLATNNNPITFSSPITLIGDVVLNSGSTGANITLSSTVDGSQAISLTAGTGNITFNGDVGDTTPLTSITLVSANNFTSQAVSAGSLTQTNGTGTSIFNGSLSTSGTAGINLTGSQFQFISPVATTGNGPFSLQNSASATIGSGAPFNLTGPFTQTGGGTLSIGTNITTSSSSISLASPMILTNGVTLNSSTGNGNITVSDTVDGTQTFSALAGSGNVMLGGAIGSTTPLASLTCSGNNVSIANIGGTSAGVNGATNLTATQILTLTGSTYNANAQTYTASSIDLNAGSLTTFSTAGNAITFTSPIIQLAAGTDLTIDTLGASINLPAIQAPANNLRNLNLNAGTGNIQLSSIGSTNNAEFATVTLTGGDLYLEGSIVSNAVTFNPVTGQTIFLGSNITTTNTSLVFPVAVVLDLVANATLSTGSTGADITFQSTVDGDGVSTRNLTLAAGAGNITFDGSIGGIQPLGSLTLTSANNVTANAITAGSIAQNSGTGTTTFNGLLTTSGLLGIDLTGNAFTFNNTVTASGNGNLTITNSGLLNLTSTAELTLSGRFSQLGTGPVQLADQISSSELITFAGPVTLAGATSLSTSAVSSAITFANTVDGAYDLTLAAGTSSINFLDDVGSTTNLGTIIMTSEQDINSESITADSIQISGGTGIFTFNGPLNTNGTNGISISGNNFVFGGNVTTTNGGSVVLTNAGTITTTGPIIFSVDGSGTQNGSGPISLAGQFITFTGPISILSPVTLMEATFLDTTGSGTTSGSNITFNSTIDGSNDITLTAGTGNISFDADIGSITPIGDLVIISAANVTAENISAGSFTQQTGTGTTLFNGNLTTSDATGIAITTNAITQNAGITTSGSAPVTITNSGLFTSPAAATISVDGPFTQNGSGAVSFGGTLTTTNDAIAFSSPITLTANTSFSIGTTGANITLSNTVDGAYNLTLDSGNGNITLGGNLGSGTPLVNLTIARGNNWTTQSIDAASILQQSGTGTSTFNGALNTTGSAGISLTGSAFTFNNTLTTANAGPLTIGNSGLSTLANGAIANIAGALNQNGSGAVQLSNATTAGGSIQFSGAVTIAGSATLDTSAVSQPITLFSTLDGPGNLTLTSGTANILISGNAGSTTSLGAVNITSVGNFTAQAINSSSLTQSAGSGTTLFNDDVSTNGAAGINLTGSAITFSGNATTTNAGPIAIANAGLLSTSASQTLSSDGPFSQTGAGNVSLAGSIVTDNANLSFASPVTLTAPVTLSTGTGTGSITFSQTVDGNEPLTLTAGDGDILFSGIVGGTTPIGAFTINSVHNFTTSVGLNVASITLLSSTGTYTVYGTINTTAPAGINLTGNNFVRIGVAVTTTNGGSITVNNSGSITGSGINSTSVDGSYLQIGAGPVNLAGAIHTTHGTISFAGPITLVSSATLDTSAGSSNITLNNTVDGDQSLTFQAGSGNIFLNAAAGSTTPLGALTFSSGNNVTADAITAASVTSTSLTGTASFNGAVTTSGSSGISLSGAAFSLGNVTTTNSGPMSIANSGTLTFANASNVSIDGAFTQSGTGSVSMGGTIATTNDPISFAGPMTLTANSSLNTVTSGGITLSQSLDGAYSLNLTAGTGNIAIQGAIGHATPLTGLTVQSANNVLVNNSAIIAGPFAITSAAGTTTFNGSITTTTASGINLTGHIFNFNNTLTTTNNGPIAIANSGLLTISSAISSGNTFIQSGTGSVSIGSNVSSLGALQFAAPMTLTHSATLNSGGGNLTLSNTVDGDFNLTLTAGTGNISLSNALGSITPLDLVQFNSAANVTAAAINADSIEQTSGSGTTHFTGSLSTTGMNGISLTGTSFTFDQTVTTANSGPLTIVQSGDLTLNAGAVMSLNGTFSESGGGTVTTAADITTANNNITWADPVVLTGNVVLNSGSGTGNIIFSNTVDGPYCLTLESGAGNVELEAQVGATTALNCLTLTGTNISQNSIQTVGAVQETGTILVGGNITTTDSDITLTGDVTLTNLTSIVISTGGGAGDISITGTVDSDSIGRSLSLSTEGDITVGGTIGGNIALNNFSASGNNISWSDLGSTAPGTTGTVTLNATASLNFNGSSYTGATQSYTAGTGFYFIAGVLTSLTTNNFPITFNTGAIQLGTGTDVSINTNGNTATLSTLTGSNRNLTIDAGTLNYVQIGTASQPLNDVTLTATSFTPTPPTQIFADNLTVNSTGTLVVTSNISSLGAITFNAPVVIAATPITITNCSGGGADIIFNNTLDADSASNTRNLTINSCGHQVIFNAPVGSIAPLTSITIGPASNVDVNSSMNVGAFTQNGGTGTTSFASGMTSTGSSGVQIDHR